MSTDVCTQILHPSHINLPAEIRLYMVQLLNQTLACSVDLRSQVRQACWNVKGKDFFFLHPLFSTFVIEIAMYTNLLAERIAVLGGVVNGTTRMVAMKSTLPEYPDAVMEGDGHVLALVERFAQFATMLKEGIANAMDTEDAVSAALYTDLSRKVDKQIWILETHLHH